MLNLDFLEKGLGIVPQPHFVHDLSYQAVFLLDQKIKTKIENTFFIECLLFKNCNDPFSS